MFFICTRPFDKNIWSSFIYSLFCIRRFDQKLGSSLIYSFRVHMTIRPKYVVFLYLLFLLFTTIRPRLRVLTYLFIFLHAPNHLIKICGPLPFIITFVHDHSTKKIRVLIYIFISFVHDHSTKIRGHSYLLLYSLINCVYISCATFIAVVTDFVHYIQGKSALIFRTLCPWLYEELVRKF